MIAKEGRIILIPLLFITFPVGVYAHASNNFVLVILYTILGSLFLFCINFFRDPLRSIPSDKSVVVAPADGKVVKIEYIDDPNVGESAKLVSIFLNVFNVHVNRVPIDGSVESIERKQGKFLAAFNHIASDENEQVITIINNEYGSLPSSLLTPISFYEISYNVPMLKQNNIIEFTCYIKFISLFY